MRLLVLLFAAIVAALPAQAATKIDRVVSPGGIEAWLVRDRSIPIVAIEFTFRGGAALDPAGKGGVANLMAGMLTEGAGSLGSQAFKSALEERTISMGFSTGLDAIRGSLKTQAEHLDFAADYLRMAMIEPRFEAAELARMKTRLVADLRRTAEEPRTIASQTFMATAFPGHPYSRPARGIPESVTALTADDLRQTLTARLARSNLVIGVAGDIEPARLAALLDRIFGALPARAAPGEVPDVALASGSNRTIVIRRPAPQSVVTFGEAGVKRDDPDYYAATMVNYILGGGGFNSRLNEEVREKRGLAYSVFSSLSPYDRTGLIMGGTGTENSRVAQSLEIIKREWARLRDDGPTREELEGAKIYLTGSFPLSLTSTASIASLMASMQYDRLGFDYLDKRSDLINSVTLEDARRVARRLLDPERLLTVVVGEPVGLEGG